MTPDQFGQLVTVVGYALLTAVCVVVAVIVGPRPWTWIGAALAGWWQTGAERAEREAQARHARRMARLSTVYDEDDAPEHAASPAVLSSGPRDGTHTAGIPAGSTSSAGTGRAVLTDRALAELLAGIKTVDNRDRFSANQIVQIVGANRAEVLAWVRAVRRPSEDDEVFVQLPPQPHINVPPYQRPPQTADELA